MKFYLHENFRRRKKGAAGRFEKMVAKIFIFLFSIYVGLTMIMQIHSSIFKENILLNFQTTINSSFPILIPVYDNFISADYKYCGGLGNQIFHFVIYYGIGRSLNRSPFFYSKKKCEINAAKELTELFPNVDSHLPLLKPTTNGTKIVANLEDCCNFENLTKITEKYLVFKDHVRHFHKFFEDYKADIRFLLDFNSDLKENVTQLARDLFGNDTASHKFCIHTRRSDFLSSTFSYLPSDASFIIPASVHIHQYLKNAIQQNISLIIMGEDDAWKRSLPIDKSLFHHIYYPLFPSRDQDMAFGAMKCDSFLISASASSFAFWMAFLMPEGNPVFYNSDLYKNATNKKFPYSLTFPLHWNKLKF